MKLKARVLRSL